MSTMLARIGRHRQRYENNLRLVSGCIPYRLTKGNDCETDNLESRIEVLMISSPNRDDLVFPKGGWEDDETREEAACREALEEAGIKGKLNDTPLGVWEFRSKSRQDVCSLEGGCKGYMFAMEVTEELETWPERENHERRWLCVKEAFELCRYEWMRSALENFLNMLEENGKHKFEAIEELIESPSPTVSDCQIVKPNLCIDHPNSARRHSTTFLNMLEENGKHKFEAIEELIESPSPTVSDCQIIKPNSCIDHPNSARRHGTTFSWLVAVKGLP